VELKDMSSDQSSAFERIVEWKRHAPRSRYCDSEECAGGAGPHTHGRAHDYPVLSLAGLAGTGKTSLAGMLARELGISVQYGCPTNQAASVLRRKMSLKPEEYYKARTYHSVLYRPLEKFRCTRSGRSVREIGCGCSARAAGEDQCNCPRRFTPCGMCGDDCRVRSEVTHKLREFVGGHRDLIVLDEASMITEKTVEEIRSFGVPILLSGDHGQLPPVMEKPNRWMLRPDITLEVNHRQADANGIIEAAYLVREKGSLPRGAYGDGSTVAVGVRDNPSVLGVMDPDRLPPGPASAIITGTNKLRASVNKKLHGTDPVPHEGDRVVCLINHYDGLEVMTERYGGGWQMTGRTTFVYNGSTGTVRAVNPSHIDRPKMTELIIELDDTGDCVHTSSATEQFGAERKLELNQTPRGADLWDYGYAMTCHKAQGSEFSRVVVLDTGSGGAAADRKRWLYTAATRAKDKLVVLDWR
jgi:exodeoxyribonuclease-5